MRAEPTDQPDPSPKRRRVLRWVLAVGGVVAVGAGIAGYFAWREVNDTLTPTYTDVAYVVPDAPKLTAQPGETILRIDPRSSAFSYRIQERLFGRDASTAVGTTHGIAGDIALNTKAPQTSRVGRIVVDVEQLHSDNNLRDARLRADYLHSHDYPLVELESGAVEGLSAPVKDGESTNFTLATTAKVRDQRVPLDWQVEGRVSDGKLVATATTETKLSTLGIGPINIAGLVSTADDLTLTMKLVAVDPSKYDVPTTISAPEGVARSGEGPSFENVIQPILQANCASCHAEGEVGAEHWQLMTAGDAARVSDGIGAVVDNGYMPPWPASEAGVPLAHSKRLSDDEVDQIVAWAKAGGPLDVAADAPLKADPPEPGTMPRADKVLRMPEPYTGVGVHENDYRCFLLDPKVTEPTYLTGFHVMPDQRQEIHHVQIFHTDGTQAARGKALEGADGRPGWECFGTGSLGRPGSGDDPAMNTGPYKRRPSFSTQPGLIAGWVPGQDPSVFPDRSGILLMPGDQFVLQMHYHYAEKPTPDQTSVSLQLDKASPDIKPIDVVNPLAPVEIPCLPGEKAPLCDRDRAIQYVEELYGAFGARTANGLSMLCGKNPTELAAASRNGISSSDCTTTVPEDGRIVAVFGHMHTLGKAFRMTLDPGEQSEQILLDIPTWNFGWQMNYELVDPVRVKAGQKVKIACTWDRATDPNRPQRYIVFAEGTEDEMCFATYAIIPDKY